MTLQIKAFLPGLFAFGLVAITMPAGAASPATNPSDSGKEAAKPRPAPVFTLPSLPKSRESYFELLDAAAPLVAGGEDLLGPNDLAPSWVTLSDPAPSSAGCLLGQLGDFNADGAVDAADFLRWQSRASLQEALHLTALK